MFFFFYILLCVSLQAVSQEQREKRVTVDEVPSGIYLYPEEETGTDNIPTPVTTRYSSALIEEGRKEILKLMGVEVCFFIPVYSRLIFLLIHKRRMIWFILTNPFLSRLRCRNLNIVEYFWFISYYILTLSLKPVIMIVNVSSVNWNQWSKLLICRIVFRW